jgi:hypothetical protein
MMKRLAFLCTLFPLFLHAQTPFSADSALATLKVLSQEIGPRPMGSPAERRAMAYALRKFHEDGLSEVYLMPMSEAVSEMTARPTNTSSGVAVGVLPGESDSMIVIGGHIDSAGPEIPGANDDGSGAATVIELARVLSQKKHHATLVFCCFGGEEQGTRGSQFFVKTFPRLDHVRLMLQADMTDGGWLLPLIETTKRTAPRWLVQATYDEFRALGYHGLSYPTHFLSMNNAMPGGGIGSDHEPFLEHGIPAIDLTSDINDPIHTPQDALGRFDASGLKRVGDVFYRLVERYDAGQPTERIESYMLIDFFQHPFFLTPAMLIAFSLVAVAVGGWALVVVRRRRTETDRTSHSRIPALKLFLLMLVVQSFIWCSENIVSLLKGIRYPWYANLGGYESLAWAAGLLGIWVALQLSPRLNMSRDPYRWYLRAAVWLGVLTVLFAFSSARLAAYPASALLLLGLAMLTRSQILQFLLWLASPILMFKLVINEGFPLFSRSIVMSSPSGGIGQAVIMHLFFILFFSVWAFPFLIGFAAVLHDRASDMLALRLFRKRTGLILTGAVIVLCVVVLVATPSWTADWHPTIRVDALLTVPENRLRVNLRSSEFLGGSRIRFEGRDTLITGRATDVPLIDRLVTDTNWISVNRSVVPRPDASGGADMNVSLRLRERPYTLSIVYTGPERALRNATSTYAVNSAERMLSMRWYSFPDSDITVPIHFGVIPDSVIETIEAVFVRPAVPVTVERAMTNVQVRTTVRRTEVVRKKQ